ncbi:hypothetical protein D3C78_1801030 [compost metagenome]
MDFIRQARGLGVNVCLAAGGNGGNAQRLGGMDDPHGNLATVGDQQFTNGLRHDRALTGYRAWR